VSCVIVMGSHGLLWSNVLIYLLLISRQFLVVKLHGHVLAITTVQIIVIVQVRSLNLKGITSDGLDI
jgi:hypothetical protein